MISQWYEIRLKKDLFRLAIVTLITVVFWVGMTTYKALNTSKVNVSVSRQIKSLTPSIDLDTMNDVAQRQIVPQEDWASIKLVAPEILVIPELNASQSATINSSTESAQLEQD